MSVSENFFMHLIYKYEAERNKLEKESSWLGWFRTFSVLMILILVYFIFQEVWWKEATFGVFILSIAFLLLYRIHSSVQKKLAFIINLIKVNEREVSFLKEDYSMNATGACFFSSSHDYTADLDIFGKHSLFQCISRAETRGGERIIAHWLSEPADKPEIERRQSCIKALIPEITWRQELQARGLRLSQKTRKGEERENLERVAKWIKDESTYVISPLWVIRMIRLISVILVLLVVTGFLPAKVVAIPVIVNFFLRRNFARHIVAIREQTSGYAKFLKIYTDLFIHVENKKFDNVLLNDISGALKGQESQASEQIKKLSDILFGLEATENPYFFPIGNFILTWDVYWIQKLASWKKSNKENIEKWFQTIYQLEALSSGAAMAYLHPDWTFPRISDEPFMYKTTSMGHPLISGKKRVCNDFTMEKTGSCAVVTGSNMSGKTTFLRTLGVNAVLALAGFPVAAASLDISIFKVFTSMRTQDSLEENTSSFYAELKRLENLLLKIREAQTTFYLLDEILKGTNSNDRRSGAIALIKQLIKSNTSGLISTHDLELGNLEKETIGQVINYSFNSYFTNGVLTFDYTLNTGVCRSFNATELLRQIGIITEDNLKQSL